MVAGEVAELVDDFVHYFRVEFVDPVFGGSALDAHQHAYYGYHFEDTARLKKSKNLEILPEKMRKFDIFTKK